MAKILKEERRFHVQITKNTEKGGAWLTRYKIYKGGEELDFYQAHSNPSAAKRWVKAMFFDITGKKSMKFNVIKTDENAKPILIAGDVVYKVEVEAKAEVAETEVVAETEAVAEVAEVEAE